MRVISRQPNFMEHLKFFNGMTKEVMFDEFDSIDSVYAGGYLISTWADDCWQWIAFDEKDFKAGKVQFWNGKLKLNGRYVGAVRKPEVVQGKLF